MARQSTSLMPVLKWAGGKRQLLSDILPLIPESPTLYIEPFIGGGAVLLAKRPTHARINDYNAELINVYEVIRDNTDELLELLREHKKLNSSEHFYAVRALDRDPGFASTDRIIRAARILYLNKTCYNGLYRVNSAGQLNSPYGRYKNPNIVNETGIRALSDYLQSGVEILQGDYTRALKDLPAGAFVYLDPPYMPLSESSSFTGYTETGFAYQEQVRLRDECIKLRDQGIRFLLSNSESEEIIKLYEGFSVKIVKATRAINSKGNSRGTVNEVLISG